jgi:hypothetical protein
LCYTIAEDEFATGVPNANKVHWLEVPVKQIVFANTQFQNSVSLPVTLLNPPYREKFPFEVYVYKGGEIKKAIKSFVQITESAVENPTFTFLDPSAYRDTEHYFEITFRIHND